MDDAAEPVRFEKVAKPKRLPKAWPNFRERLEAHASGEPEPIVPSYLKDAEEFKAVTSGAWSMTWHSIKFHAFWSWKYALLLAWYALPGVWRTVRRIAGWALDFEAMDRANATPPGDAGYLRHMDLRDQHVRPRLALVGFLTVVTAVVGVVAWIKSPWWLSWPAVAVAVALFGFVGAPRGKRLIPLAVDKGGAPPITPAIIAGALARLGIADLNRAIKDNPDTAVRWVGLGISRDHVGRGSLVTLELPPGCVGQDIVDKRPKLASALGRALGQTFVTTDPQRSPAYLEIWAPDENMNQRKQSSWPYLDPGAVGDYFKAFTAGWDEMNRKIEMILDESGSVFAGRSGYGKTTGSACLLAWSALDPTVEHWIVDLAGKGDWRDAALFASRLISGQDTEHAKAALQLLRDLRQEIRVRAAILEDLPEEIRGPAVKVTRETANTVPGLHPLYVFIDEVQELFGNEDKELAKEARALAVACSRLGRAMAVHMHFATQEPSHSVFDVGLRRNLRNRVCYSVTSDEVSQRVLGDDAAEAKLSAKEFSAFDFGISYTVGSFSHRILPATRHQWPNLDGPARAALFARARQLRESAGTLRGVAAGIVPEVRVDLPPADFLADVLEVAGGSKNIWSATLLARLGEAWPERYGPWTAEQLASSLRPYKLRPKGVDCPVPPGDKGGRTRRGYVLAEIELARAEELAERGEDAWES
jgi:S-DNA-T family DNA segregation ATPase FtsK/SpoIIIE